MVSINFNNSLQSSLRIHLVQRLIHEYFIWSKFLHVMQLNYCNIQYKLISLTFIYNTLVKIQL